MSKVKLRAATVGGSADEIEAAFYEALQKGDIEKLMTCWADEDDIVCVHPGGPRIIGATAICASFEAMFDNGGAILANPINVRKVETITSAMHNLVEQVEIKTPEGSQTGFVMATNVYQRTAQGWRMVAHHASPGTRAEVTDIVSGAPTTLH
ncbi:MAG: nuclear transport factor 2 family protein [Alphaproteobacteria bacterium]|nr:nuclear transport factor 2 family protein [Alphaproteobacteria bacterium]